MCIHIMSICIIYIIYLYIYVYLYTDCRTFVNICQHTALIPSTETRWYLNHIHKYNSQYNSHQAVPSRSRKPPRPWSFSHRFWRTPAMPSPILDHKNAVKTSAKLLLDRWLFRVNFNTSACQAWQKALTTRHDTKGGNISVYASRRKKESDVALGLQSQG